VIRQSLRMLVRDWRAGELRVLALALVVAVASITSVAFFADRVTQALVRDAHQLLGADLVLVSDRAWQPGVAEEITARGLQRAEATTFVSMAQTGAGDALKGQLAGVKAVSSNYPLRGKLRIAPAPNAPDAQAQSGPAPGTVWLEERLVSALDAPVGSRLRLGRSELEVAAVLTLEPERGANFFNFSPRLMMNVADVPATGLVQTGSRVSYYLYAAGAPAALKDLERWAGAQLGRGQRVENLDGGRPEMRATIDRAQRFLGLTALLAAILAGVAIALGTRRYVERHLDGCAVMRCLGATQSRLLALYGVEFLVLGAAACAVGCAIGYVAQSAIAQVLAEVLRADLPAPGALPAVQGFLVGLVLLLGFALPPLIQLKNVPAVRVIRRESGAPGGGTLAAYAVGFLSLAALLVWQAGDVRLGLVVVGGFSVAVVVFAVVSWVVLRAVAGPAVARLLGARSSAVRYGLANLRRNAAGNAVQVASLALGLTAMLLLAFTRNDLVDAWRRAAPPDAPNRFIIGIQPDQLEPMKAFFADNKVEVPDLYPMIRGRLAAVNGRPVSEQDFTEERAKRLVEREFNLSYAESLPGHNQLSAGRWFDASSAAGELSVEEGIAKTLGWKLGDELRFTVGGDSFSAKITSMRKLKWDSMKVNFFVIGTPALMKTQATSFITAFRLDAGSEALVNGLTQRFPNLTVVDVSATMRQMQGVVDQVVSAVQFVFLFTLGAGLLVLYSALVATEDERRREAAIMRVHGASRAQVRGSQRTEFLAMGAVAGILATLGAAIIGQLLARRIFEIDMAPNLLVFIVGPLSGVLLLSLNAWLSSRKALNAAPGLTLREGA